MQAGVAPSSLLLAALVFTPNMNRETGKTKGTDRDNMNSLEMWLNSNHHRHKYTNNKSPLNNSNYKMGLIFLPIKANI